MGFEVVRDTGLFLVREGVRGAVVVRVFPACLRASRNADSLEQRTRDSSTRYTASSTTLFSQTLLLPTLLSPLLPLLFLAYSSFLAPSPLPTFFNLTLTLYALSAVLELLAERWYLETLRHWETMTNVRVRIEGAAVGVKAVGTLVTILLGGEKFALLAFGVGQAVYGAALLGGFWWSVGRTAQRWSLRKVVVETADGKGEEKVLFDRRIKKLSWALMKQSLVKQFLTEGDKIVVGRLSKVEDQGGYAVALNYGSSSVLSLS